MADPAKSVVSKSKTSNWYVKQSPRRFPGDSQEEQRGLWISPYLLGSDKNFIKHFLHLEHCQKGETEKRGQNY